MSKSPAKAGKTSPLTSLGGNTIAYNHESSIYYNGGEIAPDIDENTLISNGFDTIWLNGVLRQSATWTDYGSPIEVSNLEIASGATLTATQGLAFKGGTFTVNGALKSEGEFEAPVVFGPPSEKGNWRGILFEPGSSASVLDETEVIEGGSGYAAVTIKESSPTIINSTFRHNNPKAIAVESGSPVIEKNLFRDNPYGGEGTLYAPNNDWQCNPESKSCGNLVGENVEWNPTAELAEFKAPCVAGAAHPGPRLDCLLYRYAPELRLEEGEHFQPASVAETVENWGDEEHGLWGEGPAARYGNTLLGQREGGDVNLGHAGPWPSLGFPLTLSSLDSSYPGGEEATSEDWIDEFNPWEKSYAEVALGLEVNGFRNHAYAILVKEPGGKIWLEYWYFYYYDDADVEEFGQHEGDWESVLVGLDDKRKPEVFVYSQHKHASRCYVALKKAEVSKDGAPVVFVARRSHANYPAPGDYKTEVPIPAISSDEAYGDGEPLKPALENLGRTQPSWLDWPGHWGNSRGGSPLESASPTGPAFGHEQWTSPAAYAAGADHCRHGIATHEEEEQEQGEEEELE